MRYKVLTEREYRRALEDFDRLKALRHELPNEPISDIQPEPNETTCGPSPTDPIPPQEPPLAPPRQAPVSATPPAATPPPAQAGEPRLWGNHRLGYPRSSVSISGSRSYSATSSSPG
jgi:hypothetical protein